MTEPRSDGETADRPKRALVVDYGGVLTTPLDEAMRAWCDGEGIDNEHFRALMATWLREASTSTNPAYRLERGELTGPEFELLLAGELRAADGRTLTPDGMLTRMFAGFRAAPAMVDVVRRVRAAGHPTALLSNSWGLDYDRTDWEQLFDVTVISGEVGLRKPDPDIYRLTAERLGLAPSDCVFVDDLGPNVRAAEQLGMTAIHHVSPEQTIAQLATHFRFDLAAA